jgi:putative transposase
MNLGTSAAATALWAQLAQLPPRRDPMPRRPRISPIGTTLHVTQRGHNRSRTFFEERDYREYLHLLHIASKRASCAVHAYVLMTNHVHLLVTPELETGVSKLLQYVGSRYVAWLNRRLNRTGTLWEGRFRSSPVDRDRYCLACYRYIELNPVRAGIVRHPADYRWSSYGANALGLSSVLVSPHPTFVALAESPNERRRRYAELFNEVLPTETLSRIREGVRSGRPTGAAPFVEEIEGRSRRVVRRRGRPRKGENESAKNGL